MTGIVRPTGGCFTFGNAIAEAIALAQEARQGWMEATEKLRQPIRLKAGHRRLVDHRHGRQAVAALHELPPRLGIGAQVFERVPHAPLGQELLQDPAGRSTLMAVDGDVLGHSWWTVDGGLETVDRRNRRRGMGVPHIVKLQRQGCLGGPPSPVLASRGYPILPPPSPRGCRSRQQDHEYRG